MTRATLRRPSWPRSGCRARRAQSAPRVLEHLSRRVAENAPDAIRRRMDVAYAEPLRGGYAPALGGDRAWRFAEAESIVWCVVDMTSQAALLEAVLGGPGATRPTSIERAIVAETIERLLRHDDTRASQLDECESDRPLHGDWWRCDIDLTPRKGRTATVQLFAPPAAEENTSHATAGSADVRAVPISLSVELTSITVPLADILAWSPGAIVPLSRGSLAAAIVGASPDVRLARGSVGSIANAAGDAVRAFEIAAIHCGRAS
jgi:flagellar motor switch/type III secretory pathway protein FliN